MSRRHTRRGFTLLEVLLSLSMLSFVAVLAASLTTTVSLTLPTAAQSSRWNEAASATLREFDRVLQNRDRSTRLQRVIRIEEGRFGVAGAWGPTVTFELTNAQLTRTIGDSTRVLLGDVQAFRCSIDDSTSSRSHLHVAIESTDGFVTTQTWGLVP